MRGCGFDHVRAPALSTLIVYSAIMLSIDVCTPVCSGVSKGLSYINVLPKDSLFLSHACMLQDFAGFRA